MLKELKIDKIQLQFMDSQRLNAEQDWKKLRPLLVKSLKVFQQFYWGRGKHGLAVEARKAKTLELAVNLCGNGRIRKLNKNYRQKDKSTDVLSFPVHESLRENAFVGFSYDVLNLGDIFICREVATRQAKEFGISYQSEIVHLLIHGLLHLCGYDHEISNTEEKIMFSLEDKLMKAINKE
jgi:probable rRNA maturation factor